MIVYESGMLNCCLRNFSCASVALGPRLTAWPFRNTKVILKEIYRLSYYSYLYQTNYNLYCSEAYTLPCLLSFLTVILKLYNLVSVCFHVVKLLAISHSAWDLIAMALEAFSLAPVLFSCCHWRLHIPQIISVLGYTMSDVTAHGLKSASRNQVTHTDGKS